MSAPLPPLHALSIVTSTPRLRPAHRVRGAPTFPVLARLWTWLMEPLDHGGQPTSRAQLRERLRRQESARLHACTHG
jgi:hypothetical protein